MSGFVRMLLVALSVTGAAHYYVWARVIQAAGLPTPAFFALTALLVVLWLSIPLALVFGRRTSRRVSMLLSWSGFFWLGALFLLLVSVASVDVVRAALWLASLAVESRGVESAARELASEQRWAAVAGGLGVGLVLAALAYGRSVRVKRVRVPLERLPAALAGTKIVQLSDVHIGPTLGRPFLERIVRIVNGLEPDVVVITGDLVDGSVARLGKEVAPLAQLRAPYGVYFVTGNHEYYSGAEAWCAYLTTLGIRVLRNERVSIGKGSDSFDLAGVDDFSARHFGPGQGADLERALVGRDASRELVLLAHQPRAIVEAERAGVGLQISGHTHGGQIWPFNFLVRLQQPVTSGLVRFGRSLIYVSNGTGYWGPPMRLGSPAEVTELVLEPAPERAREAALAPALAAS